MRTRYRQVGLFVSVLVMAWNLVGGCDSDTIGGDDMAQPRPDSGMPPDDLQGSVVGFRDGGGGLPSDSFQITSISPGGWPSFGGIAIEIRGGKFVYPPITVTVAGVAASNVRVIDQSKLLADLPASPGKLGPVTVQVRSGDGQIASSGGLFSYSASTLCFSPLAAIPAGAQLNKLYAADLDGNKRVDFLATVTASTSIRILSTPLGTPVVNASLPAGPPDQIALGDVNRDGKADILFRTSGQQHLYWTQSLTAFLPAYSYSLAKIDDLSIRDLDGGGTADLAFFAKADGRMMINWNAGPADTSTYSLSIVGQHAAVLDQDGDRQLDIAMVSSDGGTKVHFGNGRMFWTAPWIIPTGGPAAAALAGDLERDGKEDLVLTTATSIVHVIRSAGRSEPSVVDSDLLKVPQQAILADMDQDSYLDLLSVVDGGTRVLLHRGLGLGRFGLGTEIYQGSAATGIVASDFDADGLPDLMLISGTSFVPIRNCSK